MLDDVRRLIAEGDLARARKLLLPLTQGDDSDTEALQLLGILEQRSGAQDKAIPLLERAVAQEPGNAGYHNNLGHSFRLSGDLPAARACFDRAIALQPGFALAFLNLGIVLYHQGHYADALESLDQAVRLNPKMAGAMHYLGLTHVALGETAEARTWFERAGAVQPALAESQMQLARLDAAEDNLTGALERLHKIVRVRRDFYPAWRLMGELYVDTRDNARAEQCLRQAQTLRPDDADVQGTLGDVLMRQGRFDEALNAFDRVLKLDPSRLRAHGFRADCLERLHRLDEAREALERAAALDPEQPEIRVHQAGLAQRSGDYTRAREILDALVDRQDLYDDLKLAAHQQLGVVLDKLEESDKAFAAFTVANDIGKRVARHIDRDGMFSPDWMNMIGEWAADADWTQVRTDTPPEKHTHAFLVGFPRSGTTLLGQILSAHSAIETADEQPLLQPFLNRFAGQRAALDRLAQAQDEELVAERRAYDGAWLRHNPAAAEALVRVDKMPMYAAVMGPIRALLPDARFILALRDPRDAVLSCFMQNFQPNIAMAQFLDLDSTVSYYRQVMDLVIRYQEAFAEQIHVVKYEDIVSDLRATATPVFEHLGLEWEDGVADYREQAQRSSIATPSYRQVTRSLYASAAGRWTRYRPQLEPWLEDLQPFVERFGYE